MTGPSWGEEVTEEIPAVDPWPAARARRRAVFGRVYETIEAGQPDGESRYVGMTEQTIHRRVHGPSGHTSPASVAKDPWKAGILPGKAGYRELEVVYDTGDPAENDRALRRAEAFWIDRLRPSRNTVRPVRPRTPVPPAPKRTPRPVARPAGVRELARLRKQRQARRRWFGLLALVALITTMVARLVIALHLPWPAAPWIIAPTVGAYFGLHLFLRLRATARKVTR